VLLKFYSELEKRGYQSISEFFEWFIHNPVVVCFNEDVFRSFFQQHFGLNNGKTNSIISIAMEFHQKKRSSDESFSEKHISIKCRWLEFQQRAREQPNAVHFEERQKLREEAAQLKKLERLEKVRFFKERQEIAREIENICAERYRKVVHHEHRVYSEKKFRCDMDLEELREERDRREQTRKILKICTARDMSLDECRETERDIWTSWTKLYVTVVKKRRDEDEIREKQYEAEVRTFSKRH
jgi:hypothetical protein